MEVSLHAFLNSALLGEWPASCPGHFTPKKEPRYPLHTRLGGPHGRSGRCDEEKNPAVPKTESRSVPTGYKAGRAKGPA
jgi:hypothetical protein